MAPVYRNIDRGNTVAGLAFPGEVLVVFAVFWISGARGSMVTATIATLVTYVAIRVSTHGKPPNHLQNLLFFHMRRWGSGGSFVPGCRAGPKAHKRFPFQVRAYRDPARRDPPRARKAV